MSERECFVGKRLNLKTRNKLITVDVIKKIANMPAQDMFKAVDDNGINYLFTVYYGLYTFYEIGLFDDGWYGTDSCKIKYSIKAIFFKLLGVVK